MMLKRIVPKTVLFLLLFFIICLTNVAQAMGEKPSDKKQPNILLIISDDVGVDVTSDIYPGLIDNLEKKYGPTGFNHPGYKSIRGLPASTPRLDKLSSEGMVFTNVWAHPFCSPTRSAILTGLFGKKAKVLTYADALSAKHTSFVQKLKDEGGYSTALFGKWHLAGLPGNGNGPDYPGMKPKQAGFELFKGNMHAAIKSYWDYDYQIQDEETPANTWKNEKAPAKSLPGIAPSTYTDVVKVADAIEWITKKEKENPDKPWFAWVAYNLSHTTIIQKPNAMAVPNKDTMDAKSVEEMKACGGKFGTNDGGNCSDEALMRAMTNSLDTITGKLLDAVDDLDPNTYVIFVSDNGTPMYEAQKLYYIDNMYITRKGRGKGTTFESGALVPMAIKGPNIKAGSKNNEYIHSVDLFSTVLSLAGVKIPEEVSNSEGNGMVSLDSVSLSPILFGQKETIRDPDKGYVLSESINLMTNGTIHVAARNAKYKVTCAGGIEDGNCIFYDLANDPIEEYPLKKPDTCTEYKDGKLSPQDQDWHYCRLMEVIKDDSYANGIAK
jgi:arylsulfatase A-like enzyme